MLEPARVHEDRVRPGQRCAEGINEDGSCELEILTGLAAHRHALRRLETKRSQALIIRLRAPKRDLRLAHFLVAVWGTLLIALSANAQSFNCRFARHADEKTICSDSGLGQMDQDLASTYRRVLLKLPRTERDELDKHEEAFVVYRRRCGGDRACIEQSYRLRIQELQAMLSVEDAELSGGDTDPKRSDRQKAGSATSGNPQGPGAWVNPPPSRY